MMGHTVLNLSTSAFAAAAAGRLVRRRRGSALAYVMASMVALLAFPSLAVDMGHVYLVRSELRLAARSSTDLKQLEIEGIVGRLRSAPNRLASYRRGPSGSGAR